MATAKPQRIGLFSLTLRVLAFLVIVIAIVSFFFGTAIAGFSQAGTGFAAKAACSCRYVAGRDMDSCSADLPADMWAIRLSEDEAAQSVTARVPLIESAEAQYREGYGCVLEDWEG